jgi:hypothetical protein
MQVDRLTGTLAREKAQSMTRTFTTLAIAAAALAGCDNSDHTIVANEPYDPMANDVRNLEAVELPPAIAASHVYRCRDNSLVYIDWLNNNTARIKANRTEIGTTVTRGEDGSYTAEGQRLTGTPGDPTVTINGQSCRR